jgi:hypothetical protein
MITKGGDLEHNVFDKILSIGYELETNSLSKLTLLPNTNILMNTDITNEFYSHIINDPIEEDDVYELRRNEKVEYNVYKSKTIKNKKPSIDKNSSFLVTNDIADNGFTKYLTKLCDKEEKKTIKEILKYKEGEEGEEGEDDEDEIYELAKGFKNELYSFQLDNNEKYKINFETSNKKDCGIFTGTEWIFTYYKPKIGKNIILNTFVNLIKNLKYHFDKLILVGQGELDMVLNNEKIIIPKPTKRKLFHYPETNMYYLQTHFIDEEQELDDICLVPQMTFSCKAMNLIDICRELIRDTHKVFTDYYEESKNRLDIINKLELCIEELFENYNKDPIHNKNFTDVNKPELIKTIKSYIFLLLFKLYQYFNNYLQDPKVKAKSVKAKYLKDTLFINSRHSNYALYLEIKRSVKKCFPKLNETKIIEIIRKLIINDSVLNRYLVYDIKYVRKNAFRISNTLDKENKNYGNPNYSLISYFEFFENPIKEHDDNDNDDDNHDNDDDNDEKTNNNWSKNSEIIHDWLKYNSLDVFSSVMEIKNDIILIEVRQFGRILSTLISSIANDELLQEIISGSCNRILKTNSFNLRSFTIKTLYLFADLYEKSIQQKSIDKSRNNNSISILKKKTKKNYNSNRKKTRRKK